MFSICCRPRSPSQEEQEEQRAREEARVEACQQRMHDEMTEAFDRLLAQDPSPPQSLVSVLVCYPENTRFNVNRRRDVGRYLRNIIESRVDTGFLRAEPAFHSHDCRAMAVVLKDDGRYPRTSPDFLRHLNRRALEAINLRLVPCHPELRIEYPFVTTGLMLALVRLTNHGRRSSRSIRFPYP